MKTLRLSIVAMLLLGAVACKKSSGTLPSLNGNVTVDDAADMVAGSLSLNSNGVADVSTDVTLTASNFASTHVPCGTIRADSISRQSQPGATYAYSYKLNYKYTVVCDTADHPDSLSSSLIYSGTYSGSNMSSSNSGSSIFMVSGLGSTSSDFVINGEYKRAGSFSSKIDTAKHGDNNIDIVVKALTLKRPLRNIVSGTATISITGDVPNKGSFSYNGTLVFNGNGTATLTINGTVYTINLATGGRIRV
jgi:hypothetical protein